MRRGAENLKLWTSKDGLGTGLLNCIAMSVTNLPLCLLLQYISRWSGGSNDTRAVAHDPANFCFASFPLFLILSFLSDRTQCKLRTAPTASSGVNAQSNPLGAESASVNCELHILEDPIPPDDVNDIHAGKHARGEGPPSYLP